jgi:preprotein translocase subunit SecE
MNPGEKIKDWAERTKEFYLEVRSEMRKVSWPGRQEVFSTTLIVIAAVLFFGAYLGVVDVALGAGVARLLNYFNVAS